MNINLIMFFCTLINLYTDLLFLPSTAPGQLNSFQKKKKKNLYNKYV